MKSGFEKAFLGLDQHTGFRYLMSNMNLTRADLGFHTMCYWTITVTIAMCYWTDQMQDQEG